LKVLIIGGTGFIGRHLTKICAENGHEVAIFHKNKKAFLSIPNVVKIIGDRENILFGEHTDRVMIYNVKIRKPEFPEYFYMPDTERYCLQVANYPA